MADSRRHVNPIDRVKGHSRNREALVRALEGEHFPHAVLFLGPEGVGKKTLALALAANLVCTPDDSPESWELAASGHHPDVVMVSPPENKKEILIDQIRALEERLGAGPLKGQAVAVIMDPADKMNARAANALLKTLEEPPPGTYFFLVTTTVKTLPQPVVSRCQVYRFGPLKKDEFIEVLRNLRPDANIGDTDYDLSEGSVSAMLSLMEQPELHDLVSRLMLATQKGTMPQILALSEEVASLDSLLYERILRMMLSSAAARNRRGDLTNPEKWRKVLTDALGALKINANRRLLMERVLWQLRKG